MRRPKFLTRPSAHRTAIAIRRLTPEQAAAALREGLAQTERLKKMVADRRREAAGVAEIKLESGALTDRDT